MSVCMLSDPACANICLEPTIDMLDQEPGPPGYNNDADVQELPVAKRDVTDNIPASLAYTNTDGPIRIKATLKGNGCRLF